MRDDRAAYGDGFYRRRDAATRASAEAVISAVWRFGPFASVVDVGCGVGTFLDVARRHGAREVLGIEGDWVDPGRLAIPPESFLRHDLEQPLELDRRFDLVISLEVAEHLPPEGADSFVETLTRLGPLVLFSAAVPFQRGRGHRNEQWPEYWAERFARRGYAAADALRPRLWNDPAVRPWYAQNALLYAHRDLVAERPELAAEVERTDPGRLAIVHPRLYERNSDPRRRPLSEALRALPHLLRAALRRRLAGRGRR